MLPEKSTSGLETAARIFSVCRVLCARAVGATSSEDFLVNFSGRQFTERVIASDGGADNGGLAESIAYSVAC